MIQYVHDIVGSICFYQQYKISIKCTSSISVVSHFDFVGNDSPPVEDVCSYRYALFRSKNTTFFLFGINVPTTSVEFYDKPRDFSVPPKRIYVASRSRPSGTPSVHKQNAEKGKEGAERRTSLSCLLEPITIQSRATQVSLCLKFPFIPTLVSRRHDLQFTCSHPWQKAGRELMKGKQHQASSSMEGQDAGTEPGKEMRAGCWCPVRWPPQSVATDALSRTFNDWYPFQHVTELMNHNHLMFV